ncbi:hypothetical protein Cob_v003187 [Colletotrichum orbiculare MAFF 240422]|uniref:Uncharacterized protein n=1 Tax=Colletotrichum orbiculare (strain 104-T / ATCC 96160 / CBS 514.97 / LARS 414 / MAFF 240422) TaxID=1213857 RepID=A0A484G142_COLOR|nr:hypothetical protein Cob_v003187 [Colletotrichum orbiculare MAFF 240422]
MENFAAHCTGSDRARGSTGSEARADDSDDTSGLSLHGRDTERGVMQFVNGRQCALFEPGPSSILPWILPWIRTIIRGGQCARSM